MLALINENFIYNLKCLFLNFYSILFGCFFIAFYLELISKGIVNYIFVLILGFLFSGIELASRYKDDPVNAINSLPGIIYLLINGIISCFGYFIITTFSLNFKVESDLPINAQIASDIILASMSSFFIMRSSFLTLGGENNQIDLGLNVIIKKLILIVDRQVDRYQASSRAKDITNILKDVSLRQLEVQVMPLCLQVMQNVSQDELNEINEEFESFAIFEADYPKNEETKKLSAGLMLYSLVGKKVLETTITHLKLEKDNDSYNKAKKIYPQNEGDDLSVMPKEVYDKMIQDLHLANINDDSKKL